MKFFKIALALSSVLIASTSYAGKKEEVAAGIIHAAKEAAERVAVSSARLICGPVTLKNAAGGVLEFTPALLKSQGFENPGGSPNYAGFQAYFTRGYDSNGHLTEMTA